MRPTDAHRRADRAGEKPQRGPTVSPRSSGTSSAGSLPGNDNYEDVVNTAHAAIQSPPATVATLDVPTPSRERADLATRIYLANIDVSRSVGGIPIH